MLITLMGMSFVGLGLLSDLLFSGPPGFGWEQGTLILLGILVSTLGFLPSMKIALMLIASTVFCLLIEVGYRIIDPYPYFPFWERNKPLSQHDPLLGWKGVAGGRELFVTFNAKVLLRHSQLGFRDLEPKERSVDKEAIVFLGDSFTWGYEVEFEDMFVNIVRQKLPQFEVFNLSHRGYGTDQELLTFKEWQDNRELRLVILMFSDNDVDDNNSTVRYQKRKPKFELSHNQLLLTNVPVPQSGWEPTRRPATAGIEWIKYIVSKSHFLHDVYFRLSPLFRRNQAIVRESANLRLTEHIIQELKAEVLRRKGELIVIFIPSPVELTQSKDYVPYQAQIRPICRKLELPCFDLSPYLKRVFFRTYFRDGGHLNSYGHSVAAEAIHEILAGSVLLTP